ncbi:OmpH family outer membrane protein [bacterium]|nr:OmpH family outer membrane protein [bacterium]
MKKSFKFLAVALTAFAIGITTSNYAISNVPSNFKVAIVNVPKVVESSAQVKALKAQNTKNVQELAKFGETAQAAIAKETDPKKQKALKEKYQKDFQTKRTAMTKAYETKLVEIDKNISTLITTQAKSKGYDLVLAKSAVLMGGTDITDEIARQVK